MDEEGTWMNISWIHRWRLSPYAFTFRNICGFLGLWEKNQWMDEEGTWDEYYTDL
jgi:hypothetical protein